MQTLFDRTLADQLQARTAGLAGNPPALWGTMTAAQAAAHCADALAIASGDRHSPRVFLGHLLGWVIKPMAVGIDSPNTSTITCGSLARERSLKWYFGITRPWRQPGQRHCRHRIAKVSVVHRDS